MSFSDAELAPLRVPLKDIVSATNNFGEEKLLKRGGKAYVYKGELLLRSGLVIDVVIRKYISTLKFDFHREVNRLSSHKHRYVVSFIGFCDEKDEKIIVMEHAVNGSLEKHLTTLTWSQKLHICFGTAVALRYWYDEHENNYHLKMDNSFRILLDKDWEAKIVFCTKALYETEHFESDAYALGLILLEVLYGRKATIQDAKQYQPMMMAKALYQEEGRTQMHPQALSIFSQIAYDCLKEQRTSVLYKNRLDILSHVVTRLKEPLQIQWKHENLLQLENLAYMKIPFSQIKLSKRKRLFAHITHTTSCNVYKLYKAELDHSDKESVLTTKWDIRGEPPKKTITLFECNECKKIPKDFFAEVEMLSNYKHPNMLPFLGFCEKNSKMFLVFEGSFKKTLNDYLRMNDLTWEQRIRICLGIAHWLKYREGQASMIHQVIQSAHVFLDEKFTVKIANFKLYRIDLDATSLWRSRPEDLREWLWGRRIIVDDIYSLGVILFEILTGKLAYEPFYYGRDVTPLVSEAMRHFHEGNLKNNADPGIIEEAEYSLDIFSEITYQCLTLEPPSERRTFEVVIKSLEKALDIQNAMSHVQKLGHMKIPLQDIKSATNNFDTNYRIGSGGYAEVYKGKLTMKSKDEHLDTLNTVAIKRIISRKDSEGIEGFFAEVDVGSKCNHPNIVSLRGFCVQGGEMLLVYELVSNGSLDDYLRNTDKMINHTWTQRLKICIGIAHGLSYLHTTMEDKEGIIHRDIKSDNILLGENWEAKIADFGLSKLHLKNQHTINTNNIAGTDVYLDPEYARTGRLKRASDIYSFGVVLFEMFSGKLAYDTTYMEENDKGLAPIAQRHYEKKTLKDIFDSKIMDEASELGLTLKVKPDHNSVDVFAKIASQCLERTQDKRPTIRDVIDHLKKALHFQENRMKTLKYSPEQIKLGVENFSEDKCITRGGYGLMYKGILQDNNRHKNVIVKRFTGQEHGFLKEFEVLFKYKQENIIGLVGYCNEMDEKFIVYEDASNGCLSTYLNNSSFSWSTRLKICVDIAKGLKFIHEGDVRQDLVIHRDIKSSNILLTDDWKAKVCGFEFALTYPSDKEIEYNINNVVGSVGYCDPSYSETKFLTKESDIYSFGVILFELLCGRLACLDNDSDYSPLLLDVLVKSQREAALLEEMVFEGIKKHIVWKSFDTFQRIAFQCLHNKREERPTAADLVIQLQKALEFQEGYEIRKAKLDRTYKEILHEFSRSPEIYSKMQKKDIYNILSKGILLEDDRLLIEQKIWDMEHSFQFIGKHDEDYHSDPGTSAAITRKYSKRRHNRHMSPITLNTETTTSSSTFSNTELHPR